MRVAIGQFGGPTVVLNASLYGALAALDAAGASVTGVVGGARGLIDGKFVELSGSSKQATWLMETPGAVLGAGRHASIAEQVDDVVHNLRRDRIDGILLLGGNGTMALAQALSREAGAQGYALQVIGVPKTIDNDIQGIDHTPGYPSAAHFVLKALRDLSIDLDAMVGFEDVRVVEVMGRYTGWLAAVATMLPYLSADLTLRHEPEGPAPLIYLPEKTFDPEQMIRDVRNRLEQYGRTLVVVSEGVREQAGERITQMGTDTGQSSSMILGGIGAHVAHRIRTELGRGVRYENLGLLQRCFVDAAVPLDRAEATRLGEEGARAILQGRTGEMVGMVRASRHTSEYCVKPVCLSLETVAGKDRLMTTEEQQLDKGFIRWLKPLVQLEAVKLHQGLAHLLAGDEGQSEIRNAAR